MSQNVSNFYSQPSNYAEAIAGQAASSVFGRLLNAQVEMRKTGQPTAASASFMRQRVRALDLRQLTPVRADGGWNVYVSDALDFGWVSCDFAAQAVIFEPDTWELLLLSPETLHTVLHDVRGGASGLKTLTPDVIQKLHRIKDLGIVREDEITQLEAQARQLVLEAASINAQSGVSANEVAQFTIRSQELIESYTALENRVLGLKALVEASFDAVQAAI